MKRLLPLFLLFALACEESQKEKTKKDLDSIGQSVEKSAEKAKEKVDEVVQDIKRDSTVKKIGSKLKDIGDRSR